VFTRGPGVWCDRDRRVLPLPGADGGGAGRANHRDAARVGRRNSHLAHRASAGQYWAHAWTCDSQVCLVLGRACRMLHRHLADW